MVLGDLQREREERGEDQIETPPLRYWYDRLYRWDGRIWTSMDYQSAEITRILQAVAPEMVSLTTNLINSVVRNIEAKTLFRAVVAPVWVDGEDPMELCPAQVLVCDNCVLDMSSPTDGWRESAFHHNAQLFAVNHIPHEYHPAAECRLWEASIAEILPRETEDDRRIEVLQEYMGYTLMPWANHIFEAFLLMFGGGSNGKSTVTDTLAHVLGSDNYSAVSLRDFSQRFSPVRMAGKLANIAPDLPWIERTDEGQLKQLVSGETTQAENKYKDPFAMNPTAKLWFATNPPLPKFADTSNGLWRRMILMPFRRAFAQWYSICTIPD